MLSTRLGALDGLPEIDIHHIFEVAALFRLGMLVLAGLAAEELGKDVAKTTAGFGAPPTRSSAPRQRRRRPGAMKSEKSKPLKSMPGWRTLRAAGSALAGAAKPILRIETVLVVHLALLGVAQHVVGFLHVLEALFGGLVARDSGRDDTCAQASGKPCGCRRRRAFRHAQGFVIFVLGRRHSTQ